MRHEYERKVPIEAGLFPAERSGRAPRVGQLLLFACLVTSPAWAGWTSSITGTVVEIRQFTPDQAAAQTVWFSLSSMPSTGCPSNGDFAFSPANVTDAQVLKNFLATLLTAKATGQQVTVGYDSGASCDPSGYPRIFELMLGG